MAILFVMIVNVVLATFIYRRCFRKKSGPSLPPGPKPLPIVGNIMDLPPKGVLEFQHWLKHKETYGPISSITVMGATLVIIHDKQAAYNLLERGSIKTSDRPTLRFAFRLCGFGSFLGNQQYDNIYFRRGRKYTHQLLGTKAATNHFDDIQEVEVRRFLLRVLNTPENLIQHVRTEVAAIVLKMLYGYSIERNKADILVDLVRRMMANLSSAAVPLAWMVDIIPALEYLPGWFPGMAFKETARRWDKINKALAEIPYTFVRRQMATRSHRPSYVSKLVQQSSNGDTEGSKLSRDDEYCIKWTAASLYAGGADTSVLTLSSFILAMIMFPEVQRKAQEEIDRVIGTDQLPGFADRVKLPYVEGVVMEAHRWCNVTPMGNAHATSEDIIYNGYFIPKGAILLPAIWWFLHDHEVYVDPSSFSPERYLEPRNEPDPKPVVFGYGRRICPGRHFADSTIFLTIAQTLAAFNISKAIDEQGKEIEPKLEVTIGRSSKMVDFPYRIVPRSAKQAELVRSIETEQPLEESDAGLLEGTTIRAVISADQTKSLLDGHNFVRRGTRYFGSIR